ncbi:MAG: hypothetical protein AAFY73_12170 [Pseudomonadota bacterium]
MTNASSQTASPGSIGKRLPAASLLLLLQFITMWGAFFILFPAINWPASLDEPPAVILPLILDQSTAVFWGYLSYLVHAVALIPLAIFLRDALGLKGSMGTAIISFGVLAGFAKALGITRWLFLMPGLAAAYTDPSATEASQTAIGVVYEAFNAYAGGVGELMGVGLFAGIWTILISATLVKSGSRLTGYAGYGAAALLLSTLLSVFGIESPIMLTLSGILWQFWTVSLAIAIWRAR